MLWLMPTCSPWPYILPPSMASRMMMIISSSSFLIISFSSFQILHDRNWWWLIWVQCHQQTSLYSGEWLCASVSEWRESVCEDHTVHHLNAYYISGCWVDKDHHHIQERQIFPLFRRLWYHCYYHWHDITRHTRELSLIRRPHLTGLWCPSRSSTSSGCLSIQSNWTQGSLVWRHFPKQL